MNKNAVTLMELMIVVVVVGIMAAFAIPNYSKANSKAEEKQLITNMRSIISAQKVFKAQKGDYWPSYNYGGSCGGHGLTEINTDLRLNIPPSTKYTYECSAAASQQFECTVEYGPGGWELFTDQGIADGNAYPQQVCCSSGNCPTVPAC